MNEDRYFGSDLNKYIHSECTKQMSCINIDCLLLRFSKKRLRIIESKHTLERLKQSQLKILQILFKLFKIAEKCKWFPKYFDNWELDIWIVIGDLPYENVIIKHPFYDLKYNLNNEQFKQWLEFELDLNANLQIND